MEKNADEGLCLEDEEHRALVSSLPLQLSVSPIRFRLFQGCWFMEHTIPGIINAQRFFRPRPTDAFLVSYPKSGTTWLKALTFATMTRNRHSLDASHPLHTLNPHECVPFFDVHSSSLDKLAKLDAMDNHEPRLIATHRPFTFLPDSIKTSDSYRLVYICRDPKDVVVSAWHFRRKQQVKTQVENESLPFDKLFEMFCQGIFHGGSIWDHALGYWNESIRAPQRVMFLKYEELLENPVDKLLKLAEFMGCAFTEEEVATRVPEEIVSLCSFDNLRDVALKHNREHGLAKIKTESFYRKGVAGDWQNYMNPEMKERLDQITREKLRGTGLSL